MSINVDPTATDDGSFHAQVFVNEYYDRLAEHPMSSENVSWTCKR